MNILLCMPGIVKTIIQHEWGKISGFEMVSRFWKVMTKSGYVTHGETYCAEDEVLWWTKGGRLKPVLPVQEIQHADSEFGEQ